MLRQNRRSLGRARESRVTLPIASARQAGARDRVTLPVVAARQAPAQDRVTYSCMAGLGLIFGQPVGLPCINQGCAAAESGRMTVGGGPLHDACVF